MSNPPHGSPSGGPPIPQVRFTPVFRLVFFSVLALTVLSLLVSVYLAGVSEPTEQANRLFVTCTTSWQMGFGAIVGLIGGKAL
jgi:hypothetical protein